jgi:hypothetical protein
MIPEFAGNDREEFIYESVLSGDSDFSFSPIHVPFRDGYITVNVFIDALKIEGVRVCLSAKTQQRIADITHCLLITPTISDLIWINKSIEVPPFPMKISSSTNSMREHSSKIDKFLSSKNYSGGIVSNTGKHWVLDNSLLSKPGRSMNYGWYNPPKGIKPEYSVTKSDGKFIPLIQGRGTAHDIHHSDYSQTCVLVSRICMINGKESDIKEILMDPVLSWSLSHQGPMKTLRVPGVEEEKGDVVLPTTIFSVLFKCHTTS